MVLFSLILSYTSLITWFISMWCFITLFNSYTYGDNWLPDLYNRLNVNDSFINSFNYFWTSITYLPTFFLLTLLITLFFNSVYTWGVLTLLLPLIIFAYTTELSDFLISNWFSINFNINDSEVNLLLVNSLNKYHPFILYLSSFYLIILYFSTINTSLFNPNFYLNNSLKLNFNNNLAMLIINIAALFLGSWWALQEGTWGGWWNWDSSEVLGLLISLAGLVNLHSQVTNSDYSQLRDSYYPQFIYIVLSYLFIQLNFELTSHSFGSSFTYFFNSNLFFFEAILILLTLSLYYLQRLFSQNSNYLTLYVGYFYYNHFSYTGQWLWAFGLIVLLQLLIFFSFTPLLNYFLWRYLKVNGFNTPYLYPPLVTILVVLVNLLFSKNRITFYYTSCLLVVLYQLHILLLPLLLIIPLYTWFNSIHWLVIALGVGNLYSYQLQVTYWFSYTNSQEITHGINSNFITQVTYCCDYFFQDNATHYTNQNSSPLSSLNTFYNSNTVNLQNFLLIMDYNTFCNVFMTSMTYRYPSLLIELNSLNIFFDLTNIFVMAVLSSWYYYYNPINNRY